MRVEAPIPACGGDGGFVRRKDEDRPYPACGGDGGFVRRKEKKLLISSGEYVILLTSNETYT